MGNNNNKCLVEECPNNRVIRYNKVTYVVRHGGVGRGSMTSRTYHKTSQCAIRNYFCKDHLCNAVHKKRYENKDKKILYDEVKCWKQSEKGTIYCDQHQKEYDRDKVIIKKNKQEREKYNDVPIEVFCPSYPDSEPFKLHKNRENICLECSRDVKSKFRNYSQCRHHYLCDDCYKSKYEMYAKARCGYKESKYICGRFLVCN